MFVLILEVGGYQKKLSSDALNDYGLSSQVKGRFKYGAIHQG
jgi:hypothetical protein